MWFKGLQKDAQYRVTTQTLSAPPYETRFIFNLKYKIIEKFRQTKGVPHMRAPLPSQAMAWACTGQGHHDVVRDQGWFCHLGHLMMRVSTSVRLQDRIYSSGICMNSKSRSPHLTCNVSPHARISQNSHSLCSIISAASRAFPSQFLRTQESKTTRHWIHLLGWRPTIKFL